MKARTWRRNLACLLVAISCRNQSPAEILDPYRPRAPSVLDSSAIWHDILAAAVILLYVGHASGSSISRQLDISVFVRGHIRSIVLYSVESGSFGRFGVVRRLPGIVQDWSARVFVAYCGQYSVQ